MPDIEMKLRVNGVRVVVRGRYLMSTITSYGRRQLQHLTVTSVRLDQPDAELADLIEGYTLERIERAMRAWALRKENQGRNPHANYVLTDGYEVFEEEILTPEMLEARREATRRATDGNLLWARRVGPAAAASREGVTHG